MMQTRIQIPKSWDEQAANGVIYSQKSVQKPARIRAFVRGLPDPKSGNCSACQLPDRAVDIPLILSQANQEKCESQYSSI